MIPALVFYGIVPCVAIRSSAVQMVSFGYTWILLADYKHA